MCAKAIINAGIAEVVYEEQYRDLSGILLLKSAGILVRQINSQVVQNNENNNSI